jgi:hypothetical protein
MIDREVLHKRKFAKIWSQLKLQAKFGKPLANNYVYDIFNWYETDFLIFKFLFF